MSLIICSHIGSYGLDTSDKHLATSQDSQQLDSHGSTSPSYLELSTSSPKASTQISPTSLLYTICPSVAKMGTNHFRDYHPSPNVLSLLLVCVCISFQYRVGDLAYECSGASFVSYLVMSVLTRLATLKTLLCHTYPQNDTHFFSVILIRSESIFVPYHSTTWQLS